MTSTIRGRLVRLVSSFAATALRVIYRAYESENPNTTFDGVVIVGDAVFSNRARHAMRQLELADHHGYRLVQRYLKSIVATEKPIGLGYVIGVRFESTAAEGYIESDTARFAACLVRYAIYRRLLEGYGICVWQNRRARNVGLERELHAMQLLNCKALDLEQQIAFIRQSQATRRPRLVFPT